VIVRRYSGSLLVTGGVEQLTVVKRMTQQLNR
jgi:hypothetical protein